MERPGKKLLTTGNGHDVTPDQYVDPELAQNGGHGADASFVQPVLEQFDAQEVRNFFGRLGLLTIEKNGYVYPYTNQASSVLEVLLAELRRWKVKLKLMEKVEAITCEDRIWKVRTGTWTYEAERLDSRLRISVRRQPVLTAAVIGWRKWRD
ncbi:MAG: NAD(P)/FAD-dependent oxidoreductase [Lachnospiraceae bacterium]